MRNFLIDTDTASDDAVAIIMALADPPSRSAPSRRSPAMSASNRRRSNALYTAETLQFRRSRLRRRRQAAHRAHDQMRTGSTARTVSAITAIRASAQSRRETRLTPSSTPCECRARASLVTLGPLTNLALALQRRPQARRAHRPLVVMGGAPCCEGNVTPAAEYNIWVDPEAARVVFRSKLNIEMVGWHVCAGTPPSSATRRSGRSRRSAPPSRNSPSNANMHRRDAYRHADRRTRSLARRSDRHGGRARPPLRRVSWSAITSRSRAAATSPAA